MIDIFLFWKALESCIIKFMNAGFQQDNTMRQGKSSRTTGYTSYMKPDVV